MNEVIMRWLMFVALSVGLGCGEPDQSEPRDPERDDGRITCDEFCERHIDCANDPRPGCALYCELVNASCADQAQALAQCLVPRPDEDFVCDEDGFSAPASGVCQAEQTAVEACAGSLLRP
jgi:hypothetical protein